MPVERELGGAGRLVFPGEGNTPVQVTGWSGQRVGATFTGSSTRLTLPADADAIEIAATENCYLNFGGNSVDATASIAVDGSRLFIAGVQVIPTPLDSGGDPYTHVAVIQQATSGILQVEKVD